MSRAPVTWSIARALSTVLFSAFGICGLVIALYIHTTLDTNFSDIRQHDFERRIASYANLLERFIDTHSRLLEDLAEQPVFAQSLMQPDSMKANLADHMSRLKILGEQVQMVLLDFEGKPIHASQPTPIFDYRRAYWTAPLLAGDANRHFGIEQAAEGNFLTFATTIRYNGLPEGILLIEIPVSVLASSYHWPDDLEREQLKIFHDTSQILSLGPDLADVQPVTIDLPDRQLQLTGYLDDGALQALSNNLLQRFVWAMLLLALGAITLIFVMSHKQFILPIETLREITTLIANGRFRRRQGHSRMPDFNRSRFQLQEINALSEDVMAMAETIIARERSLQEAKNTLEQRVSERTSELESARDAALTANRAKSGFLAAMSHEIRTPMNAVLGILGLLKESQLSPQQRQLVQTGQDSGELLLTIINDILDFSKMEADKLQLEHTDFDLHRLFNHCIELLRIPAQRKALNLNLSMSPDLPRYVNGDPERLRQILLNLINNAIKFTGEGSITVKVASTIGQDDQPILHCAVTDTGIGIAKELQAELFDEFTMADSSHSRRHQGTGLGLAICKRLVALMQGNIGITSESGAGSTFFFHVQLAGATAGAEQIDSAWEDGLLKPAAGTRVLLAEDNAANQLVARTTLEYAGLQVDIAANGEEAVTAVSRRPYDIVLMDISMPKMDGMAATGAIRELPGEVARVPIIALTAHALAGDRERFLAAGMNDYLSKPLSRDQTLHTIARWTTRADACAPTPVGAVPEGATGTQSEVPPVDHQVLAQLARDTDPEIIPELITLYIQDARERLDAIATAADKADHQALEFETHTLGSSAAAHGNPALSRCCRDIEQHCRDSEHARAQTLAAELPAIADAAFAALESYTRPAKGSATIPDKDRHEP